jgi:hypothetical protein
MTGANQRGDNDIWMQAWEIFGTLIEPPEWDCPLGRTTVAIPGQFPHWDVFTTPFHVPRPIEPSFALASNDLRVLLGCIRESISSKLRIQSLFCALRSVQPLNPWVDGLWEQ